MHFCLPPSAVDTDRIYFCLKSVRTGSEGTFCQLYLHKQSNQMVHSRSLFNLAVVRRCGTAEIVSPILSCWLSHHFMSQLEGSKWQTTSGTWLMAEKSWMCSLCMVARSLLQYALLKIMVLRKRGSDAIEEPFLVPQRNKVCFLLLLFLSTFFSLKYVTFLKMYCNTLSTLS